MDVANLTHPRPRSGDPLLDEPVMSAYDFLPPPLREDLRRLGVVDDEDELDRRDALRAGMVGRGAEKAATHRRTRLPAALDRVMEYLLQQRVVPGCLTYSELIRAACFFFVSRLVEYLKSETLVTEVARMEMERSLFASRLAVHTADDAAATVRGSVGLSLRDQDYAAAYEALRNAKRFMGSLPAATQERFSIALYGDPTGEARPEGWELDPVAHLWSEVLAEELPEERA
jgi:hypothetical protein